MTCGIYMIKNKNTEQKYIGKSINIERRWKEHCRCSNIKHSRIERSMKKHGNNNFSLFIICELENDDNLLNEMEKYYIWKYNTYKDKFHYNLTSGGEISPTKNPDIAKKISIRQQGVNNSFYGHKHSSEQKQKWSVQRKGKAGLKGEKHPFYNKKRPEHSKKMSGENAPAYNKFGKDNPCTKYSLWDSFYCSYLKRDMERNGREPNPCNCFQFKYYKYKLPIGLFKEFVTCEILNKLILEAI